MIPPAVSSNKDPNIVQRKYAGIRRRMAAIKFDRARSMRENPTPAEAALWCLFARRGFDGWKIRRQAPLLGYIADFYCAERRLLIEADGSSHDPVYDERRDGHFARRGYRTVRFTNDEILHDIEGVLGRLRVALSLPLLPKP